MTSQKSTLLTAKKADKFDLYLNSVQSPWYDVRFLVHCFQRLTGRPPRVFREDFCGTGSLSCEFVRLHRQNCAFAVDIDPLPLQWCIIHNIPLLKESQPKRLKLIKANVLATDLPNMDLIAALNLSYWVFKERSVLLAYFKKARQDLAPGGLLIIDVIGGVLNQTVTKAEYSRGPFKYVWEVAFFNPIDHHILFKIHFRFKDGSQLQNAFVYDCRMWTLPELHDLLLEAGFRNVHVLWEGTDRKTKRGNGVFRKTLQAKADDAWGGYLIGVT